MVANFEIPLSEVKAALAGPPTVLERIASYIVLAIRWRNRTRE
jgi:hypothetical protein